MNKLFLLIAILVTFSLSAKSNQYISPSEPSLIGDYAYSVIYKEGKSYLTKYEFPSMTLIKEVELDEELTYSSIFGSEKGFVVNNFAEIGWETVSNNESLKVLLKKNGASTTEVTEIFVIANYFTTYSIDLEKVTESSLTSKFIFNYLYENDTGYYDDSNTVADSFCSKIKSKKKGGKSSGAKCKKILLKV